LVRLDHWCGNDPIVEHVIKVDLAHLLLFAGDAEPATPLSVDPARWEPRGEFERRGWQIPEYLRYRSWLDAVSRTERDSEVIDNPGVLGEP
jgi:hypothetical protein